METLLSRKSSKCQWPINPKIWYSISFYCGEKRERERERERERGGIEKGEKERLTEREKRKRHR